MTIHPLEVIQRSFDAAIKKAVIEEERERLLNELNEFNFTNLGKMTERDLASWQSKYPPESGQFIMAAHEWNRRIMEKQIKSIRWSAYMGLLGVLIGVLLTALFSLLLPTNQKTYSLQQETVKHEIQPNNSVERTKSLTKK